MCAVPTLQRGATLQSHLSAQLFSILKLVLACYQAVAPLKQAFSCVGFHILCISSVACRGNFTTYLAGDHGAVVFCLHGGGYTGLTWSLVAKQLKQQ